MATPIKHGKNATTGLGPKPMVPASGATGPSNHVPVIGKEPPPEPPQQGGY